MDKIPGYSGLAPSLAKPETAVSPGTEDSSGDPRSGAFSASCLGTLPNLDPEEDNISTDKAQGWLHWFIGNTDLGRDEHSREGREMLGQGGDGGPCHSDIDGHRRGPGTCMEAGLVPHVQALSLRFSLVPRDTSVTRR